MNNAPFRYYSIIEFACFVLKYQRIIKIELYCLIIPKIEGVGNRKIIKIFCHVYITFIQSF